MTDTQGSIKTRASGRNAMTENPKYVGFIAAACHEVNRQWCALHNDFSQPEWHDAPDWQKSSAIEGVLGVAKGNGPRESHEGWLAHKEAEGWVYGDVKDPEAKTHPCMVPYDDLPAEQHFKDDLFVSTARLMLKGVGAWTGEHVG